MEGGEVRQPFERTTPMVAKNHRKFTLRYNPGERSPRARSPYVANYCTPDRTKSEGEGFHFIACGQSPQGKAVRRYVGLDPKEASYHQPTTVIHQHSSDCYRGQT